MTAFRILRDGRWQKTKKRGRVWVPMDWSDFEPVPEDRNREVIIWGELVSRFDIPRILESEKERLLWHGLRRRYGWFFSGSPSEQPAFYTDVIYALDFEGERIERLKNKDQPCQ